MPTTLTPPVPGLAPCPPCLNRLREEHCRACRQCAGAVTTADLCPVGLAHTEALGNALAEGYR